MSARLQRDVGIDAGRRRQALREPQLVVHRQPGRFGGQTEHPVVETRGAQEEVVDDGQVEVVVGAHDDAAGVREVARQNPARRVRRRADVGQRVVDRRDAARLARLHSGQPGASAPTRPSSRSPGSLPWWMPKFVCQPRMDRRPAEGDTACLDQFAMT